MFTRPTGAPTQQNLGVPLLKANNLSDVADVATARANLGLSGAATATVTLLFQGDSITCPTSYSQWAQQLAAPTARGFLAQRTTLTYVNVATAGDTVQNMVATYATEITPYAPTGGNLATLVLFGGTNDLIANRTAAQIYANFQTIWAAARVQGFTTATVTVLPRGPLTGPQEVERLALNALIFAAKGQPGYGLYDHCLRADLLLPDCTDTTYYEVDQVHPNYQGGTLLAVALNALLNGSDNASGVTAHGDITASTRLAANIFNVISGKETQVRGYRIQALGIDRWLLYGDTFGSSDLRIGRYNNAGAYQGDALFIHRDTGAIEFENSIKTATVAGSAGRAKFGVVTAVSPSAPNHTYAMEVEGQVIYMPCRLTND